MRIGILLTGLAVAIAVVLMYWSSASRASMASAAQTEADLGPLTARIEALEERNSDLQRKLQASKLETPNSTRAPAETNASEELLARVVEVEKQLAELRSTVEAQIQAKTIPQPGVVKPEIPPATLDELTRRARDPSASEALRLAALRELRGKRLADGSDARLPVLDDMILLAQSSTDAETRTDIWRQLNHITDARLKRPLMDALAFDSDAKARAKAADTMRDFLPDAQIEAALRQAMQNDASPDVKAQASKSLAGH